jgi:hypothetical protein
MRWVKHQQLKRTAVRIITHYPDELGLRDPFLGIAVVIVRYHHQLPKTFEDGHVELTFS